MNDEFYDDDIDDLEFDTDDDIEDFYDDSFDEDEDDGYGFQSAGWGTDEDYGCHGEDY